ncbi:MAG: HIT domain-containing protein [Candidatus Nealsonbacteria bacterium]|nr:HIT domain-containing protein [Candidatus Nealsonbacteria bacterium]
MQDDLIWAPWRLGYVQGDKKGPLKPDAKLNWLPGADHDCFLCQAVADSADRDRLVVDRGEHSITVLNLYPYNNGHLLVSPRQHVARLDQLDAAVQLELTEKIARMIKALEKRLQAQGFNVGLNLGSAAGAGVPGHLHWHVVPRWKGDTNFMPSLAGINVIPQSLDALWEALTEELGRA